MDNNAWKERIEKRRQKRRMERIFLLLLLVVMVGFGVWRYMYVASPEYALEQVHESIQHGDLAAFDKYVDLEVITGQAYDELTKDMFAYDDDLSDSNKLMFEAFYQNIRPQVAQGTADLIRAMVVKGEWVPPVADDILKGRQLGIDYEYLIHRSQLRNTELIKINEIQENGNTANGSIDIRDTCTDTKYTLHIKLAKNEDDVWQVVQITNYRDYLDLLEPIHSSEMGKYLKDTADIMEECNTALARCRREFGDYSYTRDGDFSERQRNNLIDFVKSDVLPVLEKHRARLEAVEPPLTAKYLHELRQQSVQLSIDSWKAFINGMSGSMPSELNRSKALAKEASDLDYRIDDIIKHRSVAKPQHDVI